MNGIYFVTICTKDRVQYLAEIEENAVVGADIIRPIVRLTDTGEILEHSINDIKNHYQDVNVLKYCIMPDHVHLLIHIDHEFNANGGRMISAPTLSTIIGSMKRYVSRQNEYPIWQKSFYDHIIRGEKEFREIWRYIENNPVNWANNIFNQNLWR